MTSDHKGDLHPKGQKQTRGNTKKCSTASKMRRRDSIMGGG